MTANGRWIDDDRLLRGGDVPCALGLAAEQRGTRTAVNEMSRERELLNG